MIYTHSCMYTASSSHLCLSYVTLFKRGKTHQAILKRETELRALLPLAGRDPLWWCSGLRPEPAREHSNTQPGPRGPFPDHGDPGRQQDCAQLRRERVRRSLRLGSMPVVCEFCSSRNNSTEEGTHKDTRPGPAPPRSLRRARTSHGRVLPHTTTVCKGRLGLTC